MVSGQWVGGSVVGGFNKTRFNNLFVVPLNPSFKMTASFANIAGTTASASKFTYYERHQIIRNWVFIGRIIFNFE